MGGDVRLGCDPGEDIVDRHAATPHVGVIDVTNKTHHAFLVSEDGAM